MKLKALQENYSLKLRLVCDTQHTGTARIGPLFLTRDLQEESLGSQGTAWHKHPQVLF